MSQLLLEPVTEEIIPPSFWEKCCCCYDYKLTQTERQKYESLKNKITQSTKINEEDLYKSIKTFADEVFKDDHQYQELMERNNEKANKRKLLDYMGFMFEDIRNDLKGIENIAIDFFNYSTNKVVFVNAVKSILESPKILFGQTIRTIIYKLKLYMYLDNDTKQLEYKQRGITVKMGRKEMKNFAKYLTTQNDTNVTNCFYDVVCELFKWFKDEKSIQNIQIGGNWSIVNEAINNVIIKFHNYLSKDQWPIGNLS